MQLFFYSYFFLRLAFSVKKPALIKNHFPPVSIVICAKNAAHYLKDHLPGILTQDYPAYEVVLVNDRSTDNTNNIVQDLEKKHNHLKYINVVDDMNLKGKRAALQTGIQAAQYGWVLLTDADCMVQDKWIRSMARPMAHSDIIVGYSPYQKKGGWLNKWVRFEALTTAMQYLSFALAGIPYMGTGRNLAYKKELFIRHNNLDKHENLLSGDDDLFINDIAHRYKTVAAIDPASFVHSVPKTSLKSWIRQKARHIGTAKYYRWPHQLLLGLYSGSHILWYISILVGLILFNRLLLLILILFGIRLILQLFVYFNVTKRLTEHDLWIISPFFDFLSFFFYLIFTPFLFINRVRKWS